ncbi:hypothetical protein N7520_005447 [Penicillium odoratum]|uniref:uncharacterized protein n=1 Tax=Penicillium odoratum TaxID=1167516 RepID=UPI0025482CE5|nr:uncharacterized protein N7520_005447 [Penicillium odoratum]KAJ5765888.1 hypothetical protein N7520_005447 [Penicillium odoratum]
MKSTIAIAAFLAGANALVGRRDTCCFELTASGSASGTLGQLTDGQVRLGDTTLSPSTFCISNSIITDSEGRGCVITSETTQFQCDQGATGTSGFTLASSGLLSFDGSSSFIACQTGEDNGSNIYTTNSTDVTQCVSIQLTGDSCAAASSSVVSSVVASSSPASSTPVGVSPVTTAASSVPALPTSSPLIPSSPAKVSTPVVSTPVVSTPVVSSSAAITSSSSATASSTITTSTTSTSSTTSASASSAASTTAVSGSAVSAPMGLAHWVASVAAMLSLMVLY